LFGEILEYPLVDLQLIRLPIKEADSTVDRKLAVRISLGKALRLFAVNGVPCDCAQDSRQEPSNEVAHWLSCPYAVTL
jgi:hypothetical protein